MEEVVKLIKKKKKERRFVFVCGNGGSSATAEHFTNDLFSKGVKAVCLNSNTSIVTMIANDYGYEEVFGRQLVIFAKQGDLLITISCSGISENIVNAIATAEILGMDIYSFESFKYNNKEKDYETLEDKHIIMAHKISKKI